MRQKKVSSPHNRSKRHIPVTHVHATATPRQKQRSLIKRKIRLESPMHKRFLLHPATIMMLLVAGVLISGWTLRATADSYNVTAKVPAPPLTEGATITSPADGATSTVSPITVTGTCPDSSYVKLTRNGTFSGVAYCAADLTFSITTSLSVGANVLNAQDYNVTDDPGPVTSDITVTYAPPSPPPTPTGSTTSSGGTTPTVGSVPAPLSLSSDYHFQAFNSGSTFSWSLDLQGGAPPFDVHTNWGDGQTTYMQVPKDETFTISHHYSQPGVYPIKVSITDVKGASIMIQLVAFIRLSALGTIGQGAASGTGLLPSILSAISSGTNRWLILAWPIYITVLLMAISYWLGEQQMLQHALSVHNSLRHRHIQYHR